MSLQLYCHFNCKGRDKYGQEVLTESVPVILEFQQCNLESIFTTSVECRWRTGGHGQRCFASHPNSDKVGEGVPCAYVTSIGWPKRS